jgi:hypothetical protein
MSADRAISETLTQGSNFSRYLSPRPASTPLDRRDHLNMMLRDGAAGLSERRVTMGNIYRWQVNRVGVFHSAQN